MKIKKYLLVLLICVSSDVWADPAIKIYIDDKKVEQDTYYPGCFVKKCKEKAKSLKKNYYKSELSKILKSRLKNVDFQNKKTKDTDLVVTLGAENTQPGKDFVSFAVINASLGTAPVRMKYNFKVKLEKIVEGKVKKSKSVEFYKKRKVSILADTQKYKKKAAVQTAEYVFEFLK